MQLNLVLYPNLKNKMQVHSVTKPSIYVLQQITFYALLTTNQYIS